MKNLPGIENHFVLCADGYVCDLMDYFYCCEDIEMTIKMVTMNHIEIVKAADSPFKFFDEVAGLKTDGTFIRIGPTNWPNLFMIREEFQYYLAFIEKRLIAKSVTGVFWDFHVIELDK